VNQISVMLREDEVEHFMDLIKFIYTGSFPDKQLMEILLVAEKVFHLSINITQRSKQLKFFFSIPFIAR
jgi:hypothetical protein